MLGTPAISAIIRGGGSGDNSGDSWLFTALPEI